MESLQNAFRSISTAGQLQRLLATDGTAAHGYCVSAIARKADGFVRNAVDFADAAHHLSLLHGQAPGLIGHAANRITENAARDWLVMSVDGFGRERSYLNRIVVAAGPLPSTAGQHQVSTIIAQQRHALEMLAQSDRRGCALGAAIALVLDWGAIRSLLDSGGARLGIEPPELLLPDSDNTLRTLLEVEQEQNISRAVQFGASQLLGQHRGVWDLLQARAEARHAAEF